MRSAAYALLAVAAVAGLVVVLAALDTFCRGAVAFR